MAHRGKGSLPKNPLHYALLVLFYVANFFIAIGEATQFLILLGARLLVFLCRALLTFLSETYKFLLNLTKKSSKKTSKSLSRSLSKLTMYGSQTSLSLRSSLGKMTLFFGSSAQRVTLGIKNLGTSIARFIKSIKLPTLPKLPEIKRVKKIKKAKPLIIYKKAPKRRFYGMKFRYFLIGFGSSIIIVSFFQAKQFVESLPSPTSIGKVNFALSTHILDRKGRLLYEIYRDQNRTTVHLKDLPPYVVNATIAIEDKDFFRHNGVSPISGIARAIKDTIKTGHLEGGSTITQQLVKSSLLTPERTIQRKVKEIILALWAERVYSKNEILELYLNQVPYGGSAYGIEEASKNYFGKSAKDLTLTEAAFLAGLPQAPTDYSPYTNPKLAIARRNNVLKNMRELKYIDEATYQKAVNAKLVIAPPTVSIKAPHFVFYTKQALEHEFGIHMVEEGGLKVTTSLDLDIQRESEKILSEELEKVQALNISNGAILVTRPATGEILAMVGSSDYFAQPSGSFNVTTALRQPGSSIKPLMYSLALENHSYTAATPIDDSPVVFAISGSEAYRPVNYDGRFHGRVPLRYALANSYNVPAVKVLNSLGVDNFVEHAKKMGITTWNDSSRFGLSLTLGSGEVTMTDMAVAYGAFADEGNKVPLTPFVYVDDVRGQHLLSLSPEKRQVLTQGTAFIISDILSDSVARRSAFGPNSALEVPGYKVAVKTGTTNDKKDNWTVGYTPEFMVVVWVGNNNNTPMNPQLTSGITGAAPIWNRVMTYLLKNYGNKTAWFEKPSDVTQVTCYQGRVEYLLPGTQDKAPCRNIGFNISVTPAPGRPN